MVRHKARWLLVQLNFDEKVEDVVFSSKKEITALIRQSMSSCFGLVADSATADVQIRLVDPSSRLILLRVPRHYCSMVRSSLTLLTSNKYSSTEKERRPCLVASVLSVNGSARSAKLAAMTRVKNYYSKRMLSKSDDNSKEGQHEILKDLESTLAAIQSID